MPKGGTNRLFKRNYLRVNDWTVHRIRQYSNYENHYKLGKLIFMKEKQTALLIVKGGK